MLVCGATRSASRRRRVFLNRCAAYLQQSSGTCEYGRERRSREEDILRMPGIPDLVGRVNQGILALRPEYNVEVDRGTSGRMTQTPAGRASYILHPKVVQEASRGLRGTHHKGRRAQSAR